MTTDNTEATLAKVELQGQSWDVAVRPAEHGWEAATVFDEHLFVGSGTTREDALNAVQQNLENYLEAHGGQL